MGQDIQDTTLVEGERSAGVAKNLDAVSRIPYLRMVFMFFAPLLRSSKTPKVPNGSRSMGLLSLMYLSSSPR